MKRDGSLEHCPVCRATLAMPISPYGETCCHRCSGQLWHLALASGQTFFVRRCGENIYELMAGLADPRPGFTAEHLEAILRDADPLDIVELLKELEDGMRA
jgi:hypothetical protein